MATSARTPTSPHTRAGGSGAATLPVTPMRTPGGSVAASSKATAGDGSLLSSSTTKGSGAGGGAGVAPAATAAQAAGGAAAAKAAAAAAAASKQFTLESCWVTNSDLPPTSFQRAQVSACSKIGKRPNQEDRFVVCPSMLGSERLAFYGVFDGTVGDFASHYVMQHMLSNLLNERHFRAAVSYPSLASGPAASAFHEAIRQLYHTTDAGLIEACREKAVHYSASTCVTALIADDLVTIAHVADSRIAIGVRDTHGAMIGEFLTHDHKPDQPAEHKRIVEAGGILTYLHGGKPFLRGGDFVERQRKRERPMQLNYSRAFGGKDLKMFGLSVEPDVRQFRLTAAHKMLILASDGLWDVVDAQTAVTVAADAQKRSQNPAETLTDLALYRHDTLNTMDNVTVVVITFKHTADKGASVHADVSKATARAAGRSTATASSSSTSAATSTTTTSTTATTAAGSAGHGGASIH